MSATVDFSHFQAQIKNLRAIFTGLFLQFIVLPFLGFAVVKAANFDSVMGITLLIITSSPGGAYSNWFCSIFNADLALSVTMTAISTILSIGFLPLNVLLYSKLTYSNDVLSTLNWTSLGVSLVVVVCAIGSGLYISRKSAKFSNGKKIRSLANKFGNAAGLGLILFTSLAPEGGRITLTGREPIFYYGTIMPIVLGLFFSIVISSLAKLRKPERVTVAVECVYQNTGIAMTSCLALFSGDDQQRALGVPFWYTGMQTCFVGVYCLVSWKIGWSKAPPNENIFKVLLQSYELTEENGVEENRILGENNNSTEYTASGHDLELNQAGSRNNGENDKNDTEDEKLSRDSFQSDTNTTLTGPNQPHPSRDYQPSKKSAGRIRS